jgi:hypothetical protein
MSIGAHGTCKGVVDAPVERAEFVDFDWSIELIRETRDALTHIAIIAHDLFERKALVEQIAPMNGGYVTDLGSGAAIG